MSHPMRLRALVHRHATMSLKQQGATVQYRSGFTTRPQKPRERVEDPVEYCSDSDEEQLPDPSATALEMKVAGELSDCSDWDSEGEYETPARLAGLVGEYSDLSDWESEAEYEIAAAPPSEPASDQPGGKKRKSVRRGGKNTKSRTEWTDEQREAEAQSASYQRHKAKSREQRREERIEQRRKAPPRPEQHVKSAREYKSSFGLEPLMHGDSEFVAPREAKGGQGGATSEVYRGGFWRQGLASQSSAGVAFMRRQRQGPSAHCNAYVRKLVDEQGYLYVPNESGIAQVFVDVEDVIYGVKVAQPKGEKGQMWAMHVDYVFKKLEQLELKLSAEENVSHARGDFRRFTCGTAHGGGRTRPTEIAPDWKRNRDKVITFFKDPIVQSVCRHMQNCVFTWFPEVAKVFQKVNKELKLDDVFGPGAKEFNLPFAAHTFNLGPFVRCWLHRDSQNWPPGICPVLIRGDFDHTRSAQMILVEPKVVLELRSGDLFVMLSSLITHGNAPLLPGETRMSWTCWMAGGLFRWLAAGGALVSSLTTKEKQESYERKTERMVKQGWGALLTLSELGERYGVSL